MKPETESNETVFEIKGSDISSTSFRLQELKDDHQNVIRINDEIVLHEDVLRELTYQKKRYVEQQNELIKTIKSSQDVWYGLHRTGKRALTKSGGRYFDSEDGTEVLDIRTIAQINTESPLQQKLWDDDENS
jgi:hypothetical protein